MTGMTPHNLYTRLSQHFAADPGRCYIETSDGLYYSADDIERATARIANLLRSLQLPPQSRVAAQIEKSPEALLLYMATLRAGMVFVPLNTAYRADEMAYFLADASPAVVVCAPDQIGWIAKLAFAGQTRHVFTLDTSRQGSLLARAAGHADHFATVEVATDALAALLYTSGTTGRSKGAMLTHANLSSNAQVLNATWHWQHNDVLLHALPLFHIHGLFVACHAALLGGSRMLFLPRFDSAEVVRLLPRATVMMGVPTFYVRLLADPRFDQSVTRSMRLFISGSAPMLADTFEAFLARTGHTILERYGMSETAMLTSNPYRGERRAGSVGLPLSGVSVRVVDQNGLACAPDQIGAIEVRGPNVFAGYWQMPDKTAQEFTADGYFITGDLGLFEPDGYLRIVGRSKDLIISGGYNVYPKEVESVIDAQSGVLESAVIGVPHADFGEAVVAVVVCHGGVQLDDKALISSLKARIAGYKVPKRIHFVDALPRNAMGKVQKNLLREQYAS